MAKNKLNNNQKRNIAKRHKQLGLKDSAPDFEISKSSLSAIKRGIVVSRFGKSALVEDIETHSISRAYIRRTIENLTTGDFVLFRQSLSSDENSFGIIESCEERKSLLSRPDYYDGLKPVAANITLIAIVAARLPEFSTNMIDRYLAAAETSKIPALIIVNKSDLFTAEELDTLDSVLKTYEKIGYRTLKISAKNGTGISELKEILQSETTIFAGQSGVGKSTILNAIIPEAQTVTGAISETSNLGQHTTTGSHLYHLGEKGIIIDTPGVREFGLWHLSKDELTNCYKEFKPFITACRFRDCKHANDPGCAVREAVNEGKIAKFRYENYHKILESMEQNMPDAYRAPGKRNK